MQIVTRRRSRDEWTALVREFQKSGKTKREFARLKGLNSNTLAWWVSALGRPAGQERRARRSLPVEPRMLPVTVIDDHGRSIGEAIEVAFGDVVMRFPAGTDAVYLGEVLLEVRTLC